MNVKRSTKGKKSQAPKAKYCMFHPNDIPGRAELYVLQRDPVAARCCVGGGGGQGGEQKVSL